MSQNQLETYFHQITEAISTSQALMAREKAFAALDPQWALESLRKLEPAGDLLSTFDSTEFDAVFKNLGRTLQSQGIIYQNLFTCLTSVDQFHWEFIDQLASKLGGADLRLNSAFWRSGTLVKVPEGVSCSFPLQAIRNSLTTVLDRQLVMVEADAQLEYITGCVSDANPVHAPWIIPVSEIFIRKNAQLTYVDLENLAQPQTNSGVIIFYLEDGATLNFCSAHLGKTCFTRAPIILGSKHARVSGCVIEFANKVDKFHNGIVLDGPRVENFECFAVEKKARIGFGPLPPGIEPTGLCVGELGQRLSEEVLDKMLSAFPFEFAAEIQSALT